MAKGVKRANFAADDALLLVLPGTPALSYLAAAFHAFQNGDEVSTRAFAEAVLKGASTPHEAATAKTLAAVLSTPAHPVKDLPEDVAAELVKRTRVPGKAFGFAILCAAVFILLLTLALTRYGA